MADDVAIYRARAETERLNAESTTLPNVRERCERAAASWTGMADRAERTRNGRNRAAAPAEEN